jgi:DNA-binding transcriptional ArsR family regulator
MMRNTLYSDTKKVPLSSVFYALSDPARLQIIKILLDKKEAPCGDCKMPVSKSTLSHHYKVLRQAGWVKTRSEGTRQYNSLRLDEINERFPGLLALIASQSEQAY